MSETISSEDLTDLFENAPCGYLSLRPDGRIVKVNRTLANWLGVAGDALVGQPFHELLSFGARIAFETHLAPLLRLQGHVHELALDLLQANGEKLPVIANAAEKRDVDGKHLFTRITLFKALDRRAYERDLVAARERAEIAAKAEHEDSVLREQFIAVLGHDLRNPLGALAAGVRLLGREPLTERGEVVVREMNSSIRRAATLIEDVLDLARGRLGEGFRLTRSSDEPLTPVLEQVVSEMRLIAPDRNIRADIAITEPVDCDRGRLAQLASNLLANAITHGAPHHPIELMASTTGGEFHLSVRNGGDPIPLSARKRLFQPFFRGTVRQSQQGLGLGLFIVNEIARAHGGTMQVESTEMATCFTFSMPLVTPLSGN